MTVRKLTGAVIIFVISLFITSSSYSQIPSIGVKVGLSASNVSGYTTDTDSKTGFSAYLFTDLLNLPFISIGGEAGYVQKGFNLPVVTTDPMGNPTSSYDITAKINYVNVALIGKLKLASKSGPTPYILAGPTIGVKASTGSSSSGGTNPVDQEIETVLEGYKSTTYGGTFGIGLEVPAALILNIIAEARYNLDFGNSFENANMKLKNKGFEFLIGVKF